MGGGERGLSCCSAGLGGVAQRSFPPLPPTLAPGALAFTSPSESSFFEGSHQGPRASGHTGGDSPLLLVLSPPRLVMGCLLLLNHSFSTLAGTEQIWRCVLGQGFPQLVMLYLVGQYGSLGP